MEIFMPESTNPLIKHFRQPQLYIRLPSDGNFYPQGTIEIPVTKEFPVYAMTAKDELALKTPDALLNGQATVDVIESCIPNIKDGWAVPSIDIDSILIAIRRATYGDGMDFSSVCPHCKNKNEHTLNLQALIKDIDYKEFNKPITIEGLEIYLKPLNYKTVSKVNLESYENQRLVTIVQNETLSDEEKLTKFKEIFNKILNSTVEQVANSVAAIKTEDGQIVDNHLYIDEYFRNCNKTVWNAVKDQLEKIGNKSPLLQVDLTCENDECLKTYLTPIIFDTSSFFV